MLQPHGHKYLRLLSGFPKEGIAISEFGISVNQSQKNAGYQYRGPDQLEAVPCGPVAQGSNWLRSPEHKNVVIALTQRARALVKFSNGLLILFFELRIRIVEKS